MEAGVAKYREHYFLNNCRGSSYNFIKKSKKNSCIYSPKLSQKTEHTVTTVRNEQTIVLTTVITSKIVLPAAKRF